MNNPKQTLDYAQPKSGPSASDILIRVVVAAASVIIGFAGIVSLMIGVMAVCVAIGSKRPEPAGGFIWGVIFGGVGVMLIYVSIRAFQSVLRRRE